MKQQRLKTKDGNRFNTTWGENREIKSFAEKPQEIRGLGLEMGKKKNETDMQVAERQIE